MATCKKLTRVKTQVCIGSLNRKIDIFQRTLTAPLDPANDLVDYTESFTLLANVWAMIKTPKGQTIFDDIGTEKVVSDIFYIRFISGLTSENWIIYNSIRYDIQTIENVEQNSLFQKINCMVRGLESKDASEA